MEKNNQRDFAWESYYSVSNERKNDLIHRVRRLDPTEDEAVLDEIKAEWETLYLDGDDPSLEEKFETELKKFETRKLRVTEAVEGKKALVEEARALMDSTDFQKTAEALKELQTKWRELGFAGKALNDSLWEEFSKVNDHFFERRNAFYEDQSAKREEARVAKEKLIEEAEAIKDSKEWRDASNKMRSLMDAWKAAGFASRDIENKLWERFNEARQVFYKAQEEYFSEVREKEKTARDIKEKLIEETESLKDSRDFETVRSRFDAMMEEWKVAGHSGRRHEEKLWARFREGRDHFYASMTESRTQSREERRESAFVRLDEIHHSIESLESMNEKIEAKIQQLEGRPSQTEETVQEIEEVRGYLNENNAKLDELYDSQKKLDDELSRI